MRTIALALLLVTTLISYGQKKTPEKNTRPSYFPPPHEWARKLPAEEGFDSVLLQTAIQFARDRESKEPRNLEMANITTFGREPYGDAVGPFAERGDGTGLIIHRGYIIAQWGDPSRVDMTFSVTKSFLSTVVGLAVDQGLIR